MGFLYVYDKIKLKDMGNKQFSNELNSRNKSEFNDLVAENNPVVMENNYDRTFSRKEENSIREKPKRHNLMLKLISSFVVVCAMAAMVQNTFEIPIFSRIFSPPQNVAVTPTYTFDSVAATYKNVDYSITIAGVDNFTNEKYSLMIVKESCDSDEFVATIPTASKEAYKVAVTSKTTSGMFNKYITTDGTHRLAQNTNYVLLLLKNDSIVQKQAITTQTMTYINGISFQDMADFVVFHIDINPAFEDWSALYLKVFDAATNDYLFFTRTDKGSGNPGAYDVMFGTSTHVNFKFYVSSTDPEEMQGKESFVKEEQTYYLVGEATNVDISPYI